MNKLSSTEAELEKNVAYKKSVYVSLSNSLIPKIDLLLLLLLSIYFMLTRRKILQLKCLHNRSYTKHSMLIAINKLKLI